MAIIVALGLVCAWLAMKLLGAHKDNVELRARIESLRRQLRPR
jgi:hypothetical protein